MATTVTGVLAATIRPARKGRANAAASRTSAVTRSARRISSRSRLPALMLDRRTGEQPHGRELHDRVGATAEQVERDRHRDRQDTEQIQRREEGEAAQG